MLCLSPGWFLWPHAISHFVLIVEVGGVVQSRAVGVTRLLQLSQIQRQTIWQAILVARLLGYPLKVAEVELHILTFGFGFSIG